jgi:bifunctional non-homologous end joining protein LigD
MRPFVTRRPASIVDAIVEPLWSGLRAIAHVGAGAAGGGRSVRFIDELGADHAAGLPDLAEELGTAVAADEAVLDIVVSGQGLLLGERTAVVTEARISPARMFVSGEADVDVRRREPRDPGAAASGPHELGVICLDLLSLDGTSLLDVPLLERKRLLESVVVPARRVLVSIHTRPPVDAWVATWKSLGLRGAILKGANSRYEPGGRTLEWRTVERLANRR